MSPHHAPAANRQPPTPNKPRSPRLTNCISISISISAEYALHIPIVRLDSKLTLISGLTVSHSFRSYYRISTSASSQIYPFSHTALAAHRYSITMAAAMDIDKPGKYPIVLSDALLGKPSKEIYTGFRCMPTETNPSEPRILNG